MNYQEWLKRAREGTSGDMVWDMLKDWADDDDYSRAWKLFTDMLHRQKGNGLTSLGLVTIEWMMAKSLHDAVSTEKE